MRMLEADVAHPGLRVVVKESVVVDREQVI
jgi:hypothetical protein